MELLNHLEIIVAVFTIIGLSYSAWRGTIRKKVIVPLDRLEGMSDQIEQVHEETEEIQDTQERQNDAILALARSMEGTDDFDAERFRDEIGRESGPKDFLRGDRKRND